MDGMSVADICKIFWNILIVKYHYRFLLHIDQIKDNSTVCLSSYPFYLGLIKTSAVYSSHNLCPYHMKIYCIVGKWSSCIICEWFCFIAKPVENKIYEIDITKHLYCLKYQERISSPTLGNPISCFWSEVSEKLSMLVTSMQHSWLIAFKKNSSKVDLSFDLSMWRINILFIYYLVCFFGHYGLIPVNGQGILFNSEVWTLVYQALLLCKWRLFLKQQNCFIIHCVCRSIYPSVDLSIRL